MIGDEVATELDRAARRWQQLPLDRAVEALPGLHGLMADLVGEPLPDLGPAVAMDQLRVVVFDACTSEGGPPDLPDRLASLRLGWA